jgi:Uma2 family endonuclease
VRLNKNIDTVFQPDVIVVCDKSKITKRCCEGPPDLVIEIISPSTAGFDRFTKFYEYLNAGVMEYWIVDPDEKIVTAYRLIDKKYVADVYMGIAPVQSLPDCEIDLSLVFHH